MKPRYMHLPADCRAISDVLARVATNGRCWWSRPRPRADALQRVRRSIGGISQRMLTLTLRGLSATVDHAHGVSDQSAAGRLCAHPAWARSVEPGFGARRMGDPQSDKDRPRPRAVRRRGSERHIGRKPESEWTGQPTPFRIYIVYPDSKAVMKAKVAKWGNSLALRLPKQLAEELGFETRWLDC